MDLTVLLSVVFGGAFLAFVEFLIQRHDAKADKKDEVKVSLDKLNERVTGIEDELARSVATTSRVRILRCSDEITRGVRHSKEYFDQMLEDVNRYSAYCSAHPEFHNSKATLAIKNVERVYEKCLQDNDFL